ncbi:hypothetical protein BH24ACT11_BH24ACT11_14440 [soil metagenome]
MARGLAAADDGIVELLSLWVAPTARGCRVGDALVREVERWARSVGARVVRLGVAAGNPAARGLHARHGFDVTGEQGGLLADGLRCEQIMTKRLQR